jgi:hypothetical protein
VCAAADCDCKYGAAGACTTNLPDNTRDEPDCNGDRSCFGGECKLRNGVICNDTDYHWFGCGTSCVCADDRCEVARCGPIDCPCGWYNGTSCRSLRSGTIKPCDLTSSGCTFRKYRALCCDGSGVTSAACTTICSTCQ